MKHRWLVVACAGLACAAFAVAAADPALARVKKKAQPRCVDRPYEFSWSFIVPGNRAPQPNGCAPPVYQFGRYIGQDPDPNIRAQMLRDPATGYSGEFSQ
jgi:hypothetical protein